MPHNVLHLRRVVVDVDVAFPDADTGESGREAGPHNLHPVRAGIATNVNRTSRSVCASARTTPSLVPGARTICAIQHKRDASQFPSHI